MPAPYPCAALDLDADKGVGLEVVQPPAAGRIEAPLPDQDGTIVLLPQALESNRRLLGWLSPASLRHPGHTS